MNAKSTIKTAAVAAFALAMAGCESLNQAMADLDNKIKEQSARAEAARAEREAAKASAKEDVAEVQSEATETRSSVMMIVGAPKPKANTEAETPPTDTAKQPKKPTAQDQEKALYEKTQERLAIFDKTTFEPGKEEMKKLAQAREYIGLGDKVDGRTAADMMPEQYKDRPECWASSEMKDYERVTTYRPDVATYAANAEKWIAARETELNACLSAFRQGMNLSDDGKKLLADVASQNGRIANDGTEIIKPPRVFTWKNSEDASKTATFSLGMTPMDVFNGMSAIREAQSLGEEYGRETPTTGDVEDACTVRGFFEARPEQYGQMKWRLSFVYTPVAIDGSLVVSQAELRFLNVGDMPPMDAVKEKFSALLPDVKEGKYFAPTGKTHVDEAAMQNNGSAERMKVLRAEADKVDAMAMRVKSQNELVANQLKWQSISKEMDDIIKAHTRVETQECPLLIGGGYEIALVWEKSRPVVERIIFIDKALTEATADIRKQVEQKAAEAAKLKAEAAAKAKLESQLDF